MKNPILIWVIVVGLGILGVAAIEYGLSEDYYYETCPQVEGIIANMMEVFINQDIGMAASIIRLHFHDCFVRGCDASVLINSTPGNQAEKDAPPNNPSLKGFGLIDQIKQVLEYQCPGVVSCADILTYAARESVYKAGHFERYTVRSGRRDGRISQFSEALQNLPPPTSNVYSLIQAFAKKGLSIEDMVALSGAHSMGVTHCSSLGGRESNFSNTGKPDPTMDYSLAKKLRVECSSGANTTVPLVSSNPTELDNKYYMGLLQNKGMFTSDQTLVTDQTTRSEVIVNAVQPSTWEKKFIDAMIKLGETEVLIGTQGEIRRQCGVVNYY